MMKQLFVLGSMNIDLIYKMKRLAKVGESMFVDDFLTLPGGKGANQAIAASKQGIQTWMLGSLGQDEFGFSVSESLKKFSVKTHYIDKVSDFPTGTACILMEEFDNRILVYPGANHVQDFNKIQKCIIDNGHINDVLLMQLEIPMKTIKDALELAKAHKMITVVNAAPFDSQIKPLLNMVDILIVNETEAEALLDRKIIFDQIKEYLEEILDLGPSEVIMTLGKQGSYYINKDTMIFTKSYEVPVIDTTGAGDAYIGCFVANRMLGYKLEESLDKASICGALTCKKLGVHKAIPDKKEIEEFKRRMI